MNQNIPRLIKFDLKSDDDTAWKSLIAIRQAKFGEENPDDPMIPADAIRKRFSQFPNDKFHDWQVYLIQHMIDGNRVDVGTISIEFSLPGTPEYEHNKHTSFVHIFILPEYRRRGIARQVARQAISIAETQGITIIQTFADQLAGFAFSEGLGGKIALEERISRLQMKDVDWKMVQDWYNTCKLSLTDVQLIQIEGIPKDKDDLKSYCEIYTELVNQIPEGDLEGIEEAYTPERMQQRQQESKDRGERWVQFITRESDGVISGITEIIYHASMPYQCDQELTGVRETHRGRGLGKYLKTAMLLFIRDEFPDLKFIMTGNASINAPMLSINERLGFKPYKHEQIYKMQIDDVKAHLEK